MGGDTVVGGGTVVVVRAVVKFRACHRNFSNVELIYAVNLQDVDIKYFGMMHLEKMSNLT